MFSPATLLPGYLLMSDDGVFLISTFEIGCWILDIRYRALSAAGAVELLYWVLDI
jgi:hypothetical protein